MTVTGTASPRLSFGIKTSQQGVSYDEIQRVWREADELGVLEHAWLWDHLVPLRGDVTAPALEAWTLLSALAAQTSRLRLGVMVTSNRGRDTAGRGTRQDPDTAGQLGGNSLVRAGWWALVRG